MLDIAAHPHLSAAAKRALPSFGPALSWRITQRVAALIEIAAAMVQGKGAGAGWDMRSEITAAVRFIQPGDTVFDVGANCGDWSREIKRRCPGVRLVMFEPQDACHAALAAIDGTLVRAAIGDAVGTAELHTPGGPAGNASLHERRDSYWAGAEFHPITVPVTTLDAVWADRIAFLKMDIEGHELAALRGAARLLSGRMIGAIQFEFGSGNINSRTSFRDFWDLLTGRGYAINRLLPGGALLPIPRYDESLEHYRGVSNYVAVAPA